MVGLSRSQRGTVRQGLKVRGNGEKGTDRGTLVSSVVSDQVAVGRGRGWSLGDSEVPALEIASLPLTDPKRSI